MCYQLSVKYSREHKKIEVKVELDSGAVVICYQQENLQSIYEQPWIK